jgi:hypothetical protein
MGAGVREDGDELCLVEYHGIGSWESGEESGQQTEVFGCCRGYEMARIVWKKYGNSFQRHRTAHKHVYLNSNSCRYLEWHFLIRRVHVSMHIMLK